MHAFLISLLGRGEWSAFYVSHFSYRKTTPNVHCLGDRVAPEAVWMLWIRKISTSAQKLTPVLEYFGILPCVCAE
jgi:hypothetical protein